MNYSRLFRRLDVAAPLAVLALSIAPMQLAYAVGVASGIPVNNTATIDYQVGGVQQTTETTNTATFVVDNKIDLTVVAAGDNAVAPGAVDQVLSYTLTNTGNTTQGYEIEAFPLGTNTVTMENVRIYLDVNKDGLLDAGDTLYTLGTNVADIPADGDIKLLIVADTPIGASDADIAQFDLQATTLDAGTTTVTVNDTGTADDPTLVQTVFADGAGTIDATTDGKFSAAASYIVASAELVVAKTVEVISDPINGTTNPKAIPGAVVRYSITVENTTATEATDVTVVDAIPANTTYVPGSITVDAVVKTDVNDADGADHGATNANSVTAVVATLPATTTTTVTFDVTVN
uniref:DUF11 domain-containing protein n=1 Tax=Marinobacterium profundum TaxID=1714300 RepID=UPI000834CF4C|nr:DUF11 domain-containing protein [Marinobacterium profundum]